jgi:hypothetical protein
VSHARSQVYHREVGNHGLVVLQVGLQQRWAGVALTLELRDWAQEHDTGTPTMSSAGAAPVSSSSAAAGASAGSVFVKRAGDARARFARVPILVGDAVTDLAKRASLERGWGVDAAYVDLFLVRTDCARRVEIGDESEGVGDALFSGDKLSAIDVGDGAFLLARLPDPPAAAPGECARTVRSLLPPSVLVEQVGVGGWGGAEGLEGRARDSAGAFIGRSPLLRPRFPSILRRRRKRQQRGCCTRRRRRSRRWRNIGGAAPRVNRGST